MLNAVSFLLDKLISNREKFREITEEMLAEIYDKVVEILNQSGDKIWHGLNGM